MLIDYRCWDVESPNGLQLDKSEYHSTIYKEDPDTNPFFYT